MLLERVFMLDPRLLSHEVRLFLARALLSMDSSRRQDFIGFRLKLVRIIYADVMVPNFSASATISCSNER